MTTRDATTTFAQSIIDAEPGARIQQGTVGRDAFRRAVAVMLQAGVLRRGQHRVLLRTDLLLTPYLADLIMRDLYAEGTEYKISHFNRKTKKHITRTYQGHHHKSARAAQRELDWLTRRRIPHKVYKRKVVPRWCLVRDYSPDRDQPE